MVKVNLKTLKLDPHFIQRAMERTGAKNENDAKNIAKSVITGGQYIGETASELGTKGHMFAQGKRAVIISLDLQVAITVIEYSKSKYAPKVDVSVTVEQSVANVDVDMAMLAQSPSFVGRLIDFYNKELRRYEKQETTLTKKIGIFELESALEIAQLRLKAHKTKSVATKFKYEMKIAELGEQLVKMKAELRTVEDEKRKIARARVSLGV